MIPFETRTNGMIKYTAVLIMIFCISESCGNKNSENLRSYPNVGSYQTSQKEVARNEVHLEQGRSVYIRDVRADSRQSRIDARDIRTDFQEIRTDLRDISQTSRHSRESRRLRRINQERQDETREERFKKCNEISENLRNYFNGHSDQASPKEQSRNYEYLEVESSIRTGDDRANSRQARIDNNFQRFRDSRRLQRIYQERREEPGNRRNERERLEYRRTSGKQFQRQIRSVFDLNRQPPIEASTMRRENRDRKLNQRWKANRNSIRSNNRRSLQSQRQRNHIDSSHILQKRQTNYSDRTMGQRRSMRNSDEMRSQAINRESRTMNHDQDHRVYLDPLINNAISGSHRNSERVEREHLFRDALRNTHTDNRESPLNKSDRRVNNHDEQRRRDISQKKSDRHRVYLSTDQSTYLNKEDARLSKYQHGSSRNMDEEKTNDSYALTKAKNTEIASSDIQSISKFIDNRNIVINAIQAILILTLFAQTVTNSSKSKLRLANWRCIIGKEKTF